MKILKAAVIFFLAFASSAHAFVTQEELQQYAIDQNDSQLLEILMKYGHNDDKPILNRAMEAKDYFAVFILVEYGVDINSRSIIAPTTSKDRTVLEMALEHGEISLIEYFILNKADPTSQFKSYEYQAGHIINYTTTAVYHAIIKNRLDVLIMFAQNNIDLNKICYETSSTISPQYGYKRTPIQIAIEKNNKEIVALLLSIGVKV